MVAKRDTSTSRALIVVSLVAILAILAVVGYLWRENKELRSRLDGPGHAAPEQVRRVREGDEVPEFTTRDTEGREFRVAPRAAGTTLLFIFSPTCDSCESAMSGWVKVYEKLKHLNAAAKVAALSIGDSYTTVEYARRKKLPFTVAAFPTVDLQKQYGATEVPLTVVVDEKGIVTAVWVRPLDDGEMIDVFETVCPECVNAPEQDR